MEPKRPNPTVPSEGLPVWLVVVLAIAAGVAAFAYGTALRFMP